MMLRKSSKGFTLLELMVASGVLVVALVGLLGAYVSCLELNEFTKNANLALNAEQKILEEMRNIAFLSVFGAYNGTTFEIPGMAANLSRGLVSITNVSSDLLNITVGACWRQKGGRIVGECQYSSGVVVFSDEDSDGILDSPVQLTTLMAQR